MSRGLVDSAGEIQAEPSFMKWMDSYFGGWKPSLGPSDVAFTLGPTKVVLKLDLDWIAPSRYSLRV